MTQSTASSNTAQETEPCSKSSTSWSNSVKYWFNKSKEWSSNLPSGLKAIRENGPKSLLGLGSFSLFFMLGLVTLGASLLAGVAAVIMMKWQQHKAATTPSNVAVSTPTEQQTVPIDVA
ncbi:MAG: hypothetical protein ACI8SK_000906 [Shewanella sp.]|jgi:hypothetical protein